MSSPDGDSDYYNDEVAADGNFEDESGERSARDKANNAQHLGATILASKFAANTRRGANQKVVVGDPASTTLKMPKLFKPDEPDFSVDREDI